MNKSLEEQLRDADLSKIDEPRVQESVEPIIGRWCSPTPQRQSIPREEMPDMVEGEPVLILGEYPPLSAEDLLPVGRGQNDSK